MVITNSARGHAPSVGRRPSAAFVLAPVGVVLLVYVWFISAGLWFSWPKTAIYDYYSSLASAFQHGQLALEDRPSAELLALPDPYRIGARKNIDHIWDATLYKGKYYLYWGPVPALILIPFRLLLQNDAIPDLYVAFTFVVGLFLVLSTFLWQIWRRFFTSLPVWTLSLAILVAGLAPPLPWMLNRPEVYEAALAAGQFFLLCGLCLGYSVVGGASRPMARLALASLCLGLAIGCRSSEAVPAAFVVLVLALFLRRHSVADASPGSDKRWLLALGTPIVGVVLMLMAYNWARFGSVFEFGYQYQLTLVQMPKHYDQLFSAAYVLPNLYNYLLNPFTLAMDFPPIRPQYGASGTGVGPGVPSIYFAEAVTGLVWTFPFMAFVAGLLPWRRITAARVERESGISDSERWHWLIAMVMGVLALEFGELLLFFFATERYLVELTPTLTLAACLGCWQVLKAAKPLSASRTWTSAAAIVLALASMLSTTLLSISSYQERMRVFNPGLFAFFNSLFHR